MESITLRITRKLSLSLLIAGCAAMWWLAGLYLYLSPNLPEADTLRDVKLQVPMRVFSEDGLLIGQFGEQKRSPLQFSEIPGTFIDALLAATARANGLIFVTRNGTDVQGVGVDILNPFAD